MPWPLLLLRSPPVSKKILAGVAEKGITERFTWREIEGTCLSITARSFIRAVNRAG